MLFQPRPPRSRRAEADSLPKLLAAIAAPLTFIASGGAAASRTRFPAAALARRIEALLPRVPAGATAALNAVRAELLALEAASPAERAAHIERCRALLAQLGAAPAPAAVTYRRTARVDADDLAALAQPAQYMRGIGPRRAEQLKKFGIVSVEDLLYHLPFRYEDRRTITPIRQLRAGDTASVIGELTHLAERYVGRRQRRILEGVLRDDSGMLALTWFHQVPYFRSRFQVGQRCLVHGRVEGSLGQLRIVHPEVEIDPDLDGQGVLPVYNKPTTMSVAAMRAIMQHAVGDWAERLPSVLPAAVAAAARVTDLRQALELLHQPPRDADVEALNAGRSLAHRSLVFDELFFLQLGMALRRRSVELESGRALTPSGALTARLPEALPFALTAAQRRVVAEIYRDMARPHPMHRLVQGDVGSGKTVVAVFGALLAIENGLQAAFMAPTELLAEQHYSTIAPLAQALGVRAALLTGELTRAQRRALYRQLEDGSVQLAVGTHAIIQEGVRFKALGLGVIDEQHRFGVLQRAALRRIGGGETMPPDILLMTATPIPRTLAMAVYGDLDISVLDELPPGRQPVRTLLRHEGERTQVYELVKRELDRGRQGYVVYPLVESSDRLELRDATTMAQELATIVFRGYRVGLVHGKMKGQEKDAVMRRFKAGDIQLLVSTTVIEVGIDVPNATVMVVEHAERFGLSQLHQLRGRVGRGAERAFCVLLTPFHRGDDTHRRLTAMAGTNDGFKIAEVDLEIRGPGELLGTRQSGLPDFRVANLIRDRTLLEAARRAAEAWLQKDPRLDQPESQALRRVLAHRWAGRLELAEIG